MRPTELKRVLIYKKETNELIDNFLDNFNKINESKEPIYQYKKEATNLLSDNKYTEEDINNDNEDLDSTSLELAEMIKASEKGNKIIEILKAHIEKVSEIEGLNVKKQSKK